jgi:hypothetical protein
LGISNCIYSSEVDTYHDTILQGWLYRVR